MNIKSFGITIVAFLVISSIISIITPKGSFEKTIKFVLSICFILVAITSIKSIKIDIPKINDTQTETSAETIYSATLKVTKRILENKITEALKNEGVVLEKIQINADICEDENIIIDSIVYKTNNDDKLFIIEKIIYENTGCKNIERETDEKYID